MESLSVGMVVNATGHSGPAEIRFENGVITEIIPHQATNDGALQAAIAVPGFIDIHTHGAAGSDFMDATGESWRTIATHHLRHGTTSFLASTLTAPLEELRTLLGEARGYQAANERESDAGREATILGVHLEGPWISPERAGAQNAKNMLAPGPGGIDLVREFAGLVRMVTFSMHYRESAAFLDALNDLGIIAACGHDQTRDVDALAAFERGLRHMTHIYSMSSSFGRSGGYKHLGSLEMALMTPGVTVEVIADDRHITRHFWDFIRHNKKPADIVLVSDSMRWAGMPVDPDTVIRLGEVEVVVDDGVAWLADRSAFAGSITTMHKMFRRIVREWGVSLSDAVRMTSWNQAHELGITGSLGSIEPGRIADMVLLDKELRIVEVVKSGVRVAR